WWQCAWRPLVDVLLRRRLQLPRRAAGSGVAQTFEVCRIAHFQNLHAETLADARCRPEALSRSRGSRTGVRGLLESLAAESLTHHNGASKTAFMPGKEP